VAHVARRLVTCDPARATGTDPLGAIKDGALIVEGDRVAWVGKHEDLPMDTPVVDHGDVVLTPGLVDAHTHACWAGSRHAEYAVRMAGGDYEAIARAGGGIVSTHRAVAAATFESLASTLRGRLARMAALGVTTHASFGALRNPAALAQNSVPKALVEAAIGSGFHWAFLGCAGAALVGMTIAFLGRDPPLRTAATPEPAGD